MGRSDHRVVAVAASGGRDSTALLHATVRAAQAAGVQVVALHVHHGLNPRADDWVTHLRRQCARWSQAGWPVRLLMRRLEGSPAPGDSVEAWARAQRYAALAGMATEAGASLVLLAHHRRDQAETFLLQALRGGGAAGLSAMPRSMRRHGVTWARPWLDQPGEAIAAYVRRHRLRHIDDDSNTDTRYDRNRLRHRVWPALLAAFPQAEAALVQAARQAQRTAALVDEVAAADLAALVADHAPVACLPDDAPPGGVQVGGDRACAHAARAVHIGTEAAAPGGALRVTAWRALSPARRHAALRHWLRPQVPAGLRDSLLQRLLDELPGATAARWPLDAAHELRLYRGRLTVDALSAGVEVAPPALPPAQRLDRPGRIAVHGGSLEITRVRAGGVPTSVLARATLRPRAPGDDFQFAPRSTARSLKKQFQSRGVPAWAREAPVVAVGAQLVFVPGLGIDARALAAEGEPQLMLRWCPPQA